jgi:hypothetical protein
MGRHESVLSAPARDWRASGRDETRQLEGALIERRCRLARVSAETLNDFASSRLNAVSASRLRPRTHAPGVARKYVRLQSRYVSL